MISRTIAKNRLINLLLFYRFNHTKTNFHLRDKNRMCLATHVLSLKIKVQNWLRRALSARTKWIFYIRDVNTKKKREFLLVSPGSIHARVHPRNRGFIYLTIQRQRRRRPALFLVRCARCDEND